MEGAVVDDNGIFINIVEKVIFIDYLEDWFDCICLVVFMYIVVIFIIIGEGVKNVKLLVD